MLLTRHRLATTPLLLLSLLRPSHAIIYETRFENTTWDDANWRITNTHLVQGQFESRNTLANGYLGINVAAAGPFFEVENDGDFVGWPEFNRRQTFATISGFWDSQNTTASDGNFPWLLQYGGESVISGVPHWSGLLVQTSSGAVLNASVPSDQISRYQVVLDIGSGLQKWSYTWMPPDEAPIDIEYSMYVHRLYVNRAAVQLRVTPSRPVNLTVVDVLDGDGAVRSTFVDKAFDASKAQIWSAVSPHWLGNVTAYVYSTLKSDCDASEPFQYGNEIYIGGNSSSIAQAVNVSLLAEQSTTFAKFVGGASTDAFEDPQTAAAYGSVAGFHDGFAGGLASHIQEWNAILPRDAVDDFSFPENGTLPDDPYIVEQQVLAVTNPFHLLSATVSYNATIAAGNNTKLNTNSISVCGLGGDCYGGMVFWDADVWMAPGLVVSHPFAGQQIANFRAKQHEQAKRNVLTAFQSSQNETHFTGGAVYSWTSGRYGNCTSTGPCFDYEYHLNGDIGLHLYNYWVASGDQAKWESDYFPIYNDIAYFISELLTFNRTTQEYDLLNATDPDEYANHVNNPGFTLPLFQEHLIHANTFRQQQGLQANETWSSVANQINIPINNDAEIIVEYDGMNGSVVIKQADVTLLDDIANYENNYSLSDLDYYASKQSPDGPGMTYASYSVVANAFSPSGCSAYTYNIYGSNPYNRGPWFQFSEQLIDNSTINGGTHPAFPFLTGMGGANRVAVFGYLGLRLNQSSLNIDPQLPPQISHLNYRTFFWQGHAINATSNQTHTVLSRIPDRNLDSANSTYSNSDIPVTVGNSTTRQSLTVGSPLTITNRRASFKLTIEGNLGQCQPVASNTKIVPGQFAMAAIDGAISTAWQPESPNDTAIIAVDLTTQPIKQVTGFYFDWAQAPPKSYAVHFSNASSLAEALADASSNTTSAASSSNNITISSPFDLDTQFLLRKYASNSTNVTLDQPVWSGRYATLTITGTQETDNLTAAQGATVAEWAIIAADGSGLQGGYGNADLERMRRPRREALLEPLWRW